MRVSVCVTTVIGGNTLRLRTNKYLKASQVSNISSLLSQCIFILEEETLDLGEDQDFEMYFASKCSQNTSNKNHKCCRSRCSQFKNYTKYYVSQGENEYV